MKNIINLFICLLAVIKTYSQVPCEPKGISTHPDDPINSTVPPFSGLRWLNTFKWYDFVDPVTLAPYALNGMFVTSENQGSMSHPYSSSNSYGYLFDNIDPEDLDMYPEDGWELLSVNLGRYPDGNTAISEFAAIPYILLYNKQRGIIRLFANTLTGVSNNTYDGVVIRLLFNNANNTSGLLRHNGGFDLALDQNTETVEVVSTVAHPNNSSHWFHTDFQVGYDPCTCLYPSNLRINFTFYSDSFLKMVSRSISQDVPLIDANGHSLIPRDFLTGVQYNDEFEGAGLAVYGSMEKMIDDYINNLNAVETYNANATIHNEKVKRNKAILKAVKTVALASTGTLITGTLATELTRHARNMVFFAGDSTSVKVNEKELEKAAKDILGKGFDWLSKQDIIDLEEKKLKPAPSMPTGTITETTFSGEIRNQVNVGGPLIFNPGTYPDAVSMPITPHNYPVYNEVLGLFALLETPRFQMYEYHNTEMLADSTVGWSWDIFYKIDAPPSVINDCNQNNVFYDDTRFTGRERTFKRNSIYEFKLKDPLKFVFNPAAGIDLENVEIKTSLVVLGNTQEPANKIFNLPSRPLPRYHYYRYGLVSSNGLSVELDNFEREANSIPLSTETPFKVATPFVPLEVFNNLSSHIEMERTDRWRDHITFHAGPEEASWWEDRGICYRYYPQQYITNELLDYVKLCTDISDFEVHLKLMVTMPFIESGHNGQQNVTTQILTYKIPSDYFELLSSPIPIDFSLTENPNTSEPGLQQNLSFGDKEWGLADFELYGGTASPNSIRPYAWETIDITGIQTINNAYAEVIMTSGEEITVFGESTINPGFTLRVDNFADVVRTPTYPVTNSFLNSYCDNMSSVPYNANQPASSILVSNDNASDIESLKILEKNPQLAFFPNPASSLITLSLTGIDGTAEISIYNSVGVSVDSFNRQLDEYSSLHYVQYDVSDLPNGIYTINVRSGNTILTQKFIVAH